MHHESLKTTSEPVIWSGYSCNIRLPLRPHIDRNDGGHLVVYPLREVNYRSELSKEETICLALVLQALEVAYIEGMNASKIPVIWVNFQDNGNWSLLKNTPRHFHVHVYGRCIRESNQTPGQALILPDPSSSIYDDNRPLNLDDIERIIVRLEANLKTIAAMSDKEPFAPNRLKASFGE